MDQIPYRGAAPALQDIAGGHVDLFFATPQSVVQQVAAGEMKAYGITAKAPSPQFPTAASFVQELGPKLEILYWHALFAPAGTPETVVEKLNSALQEIVADPAIMKSWAESGVAPYSKDERVNFDRLQEPWRRRVRTCTNAAIRSPPRREQAASAAYRCLRAFTLSQTSMFHGPVPPCFGQKDAHLSAAGDCCAAGFQSSQCLLWVIHISRRPTSARNRHYWWLGSAAFVTEIGRVK